MKPDFFEMAREWLVRVQGHARPEHEKSLSVLLHRAYNEGLTRAGNICEAGGREEFANKIWEEIRQAPPEPSGPSE